MENCTWQVNGLAYAVMSKQRKCTWVHSLASNDDAYSTPHIQTASAPPQHMAATQEEESAALVRIATEETPEEDLAGGNVMYNTAAAQELAEAKLREWTKKTWRAPCNGIAAGRLVQEMCAGYEGYYTHLIANLDTRTVRQLGQRSPQNFTALNHSIAGFEYFDVDACGMFFRQVDGNGETLRMACTNVNEYTHLIVDGGASTEVPMNSFQLLAALLSAMEMQDPLDRVQGLSASDHTRPAPGH